MTECRAGRCKGESDRRVEESTGERWGTRMPGEHQADVGDQLHQPVLLWDSSRLATPGPHPATSGHFCPQLYVCEFCEVSQPEHTDKVGCLLPPLRAHSSCQPGGVILVFLQTPEFCTQECGGRCSEPGSELSACACGLVRLSCMTAGRGEVERSCRSRAGRGAGVWSCLHHSLTHTTVSDVSKFLRAPYLPLKMQMVTPALLTSHRCCDAQIRQGSIGKVFAPHWCPAETCS